LAAGGVLFAYFVSLPGALHFLTNFNLDHIQAMLTVDSYLSFVLTYLLGAALLFQIPLLLLIINTMTPLKPSKLMKSQRYVIVAAFLIGAVISPTPDIMNQTFLALPIVAMYELGVVMVWTQNRARRRKQAKQEVVRSAVVAAPVRAQQTIPLKALQELARPAPAVRQMPRPIAPQTIAKPVARPMRPQPAMNDIIARPRPATAQALPARPQTPVVRPASNLTVPRRSVDGFVAYRPPAAA